MDSDTPATVSPPVARFLLGILDSLTLSAGAPDFEHTAALIVQARRELTQPEGS